MVNSEMKLLTAAVHAADDKKAGDMEIIEVGKVTPISDYFLICTGTSSTHNRAISDEIEKKIKEKLGIMPHHIEGYREGNWILLDYGSLLVHIFLADTRRFYSIERLWSDADKLDPEQIKNTSLAER